MQIRLNNITKSFRSKNGEIKPIFTDLTLCIDQPDFITIIGPNGCGKSTLLNLISGIDKVDAGTITISNGEMNASKIGYVWQDYRASLLPWLNVFKNIEFPLLLGNLDKEERIKKVNDLLNEFNISFKPADEVYKLSGGQQQLICLLRSIVSNPTLLLCDEPFSALDQSSRWNMAFYLERLWLKKKIPVLFVSHDIDETILLSSKIMLLKKNGKVEDVLTNPLPRPRNIEMLSSQDYILLRKMIIEFMKQNGAISDLGSTI